MKRAAPYERDTALKAAMSLFWDKGFHATSLKDLEGHLKMKPGSIYAAFNSKENLYLLALEHYFETARMKFQTQMAKASSPLEGLAAHFLSFVELSPNDAARQACMLTKSLVDTRTTEPVIAEKSRAYLTEMRKEFAAMFEKAKTVGELPHHADSDRLALRFQANVSALRFELHLGTRREEISQLAEDMAAEIMRMQV